MKKQGRIITKKCWPTLFEDVQGGRKKFDMRAADFMAKEGDILVLEEWDPKTKKYTGRKIRKLISYVGKFTLDAFGQRSLLEKKGFYVLQLK